MSNTIDHEGIVSQVSEGIAEVMIDSMSACAACHAKGGCSAADREEKIMKIPTLGIVVSPGEKVRVLISKNMGMRAVAMGYFYPFLLMMAILVVLTSAGISELITGIISLVILLPYYLIVYLLRERIGNSFSFRLEKINYDV